MTSEILGGICECGHAVHTHPCLEPVGKDGYICQCRTGVVAQVTVPLPDPCVHGVQPGLPCTECAVPLLPTGLFSAWADEQVNHPAHYGGEDNVYEVIKVLEAWGLTNDAYLFNVVKYIARAGKKGAVKVDLEKAAWYLNRRIETLDG